MPRRADLLHSPVKSAAKAEKASGPLWVENNRPGAENAPPPRDDLLQKSSERPPAKSGLSPRSKFQFPLPADDVVLNSAVSSYHHAYSLALLIWNFGFRSTIPEPLFCSLSMMIATICPAPTFSSIAKLQILVKVLAASNVVISFLLVSSSFIHLLKRSVTLTL